jgi:hypothetical protein
MVQIVKEDEALGGSGVRDPNAFFETVQTEGGGDVTGGAGAADMFA